MVWLGQDVYTNIYSHCGSSPRDPEPRGQRGAFDRSMLARMLILLYLVLAMTSVAALDWQRFRSCEDNTSEEVIPIQECVSASAFPDFRTYLGPRMTYLSRQLLVGDGPYTYRQLEFDVEFDSPALPLETSCHPENLPPQARDALHTVPLLQSTCEPGARLRAIDPPFAGRAIHVIQYRSPRARAPLPRLVVIH